MRIIAGEHRGRKLLGPAGRQTTRPITDRAKTALFDRLDAAERLEDAAVLDLFAGTGSIGLECLSRGAAHVTFVERDREALRRLRRNLRTLGRENQARILSRDILSPALPRELAAAETPGRPFTLLFVDPPYALIEDPERAARLRDRLTALAAPAASDPAPSANASPSGTTEPATPVVAEDAWLFLRTQKKVQPPEIPGWLGPDSRTHGSMSLHRYRKQPRADADTLSAP